MNNKIREIINKKQYIIINDWENSIDLPPQHKIISQDINLLKSICIDNKIEKILGFQKDIKLLHELFWSLSQLCSLIILDTTSIKEIIEPKSKFQIPKLWDMVARNANNQISLGGWVNSYTLENFTQEEMQEFSTNATNKIIPLLNQDLVVLEIGCASGYIMYSVLPYVHKYIGTDFSQKIIDINTKIKQEKNINNLDLYCVSAENVNKLNIKDVDIIIINSVCQLFDGYCYFYRLLDNLIKIMKPNGKIFIGDVMDLSLKENLINSLIEFKRNNPSYPTKTSFNNELFYHKDFFNDLIFDYPIKKIDISEKQGTIKNELTEFRYDVIIHLGENKDKSINKRLKSSYAIDLLNKENL